MNNTTHLVDEVTDELSVSEVDFDNLYPVLLQTFVVIVLGYLSGRWRIIGPVEAKGLNTFVGHFALPCIIFTALAELDFSRVNWLFLLSMLLSKAAVFIVVLIFTMLVTRPMDLSKAGLFAIFCTQSNDFALGYPIVAAVYGSTHPEYAKYLYVMAPISLVLLNPLGFLFLELGERRKVAQRAAQVKASYTNLSQSSSSVATNSGKTSAADKNGWKLFLIVWKDILFTPIVVMTILGIVFNFSCQHQIPPILKNLCNVLSSAFSATALFALGLRMVGKIQDFSGQKVVIPGILIGVKCLVLPILAREITIHMQPGATPEESLDLSNLGFLLGTFPSAPGIFFYAIQYNVAADMIATAMVVCTFVSAPLTFVSARMMTLSGANPNDFIELLDRFLLHVASVGLVCTLFTMTIFIAGKKWKKIPHFTTLCLTFSQFMGCTGIVLWYTLDRSEPWKKQLQFMLFAVGVFSSRIWSALLSVTVLILRKRSLNFALNSRPALIFVGWGIPILVASILPLTAQDNCKENPNFQYGKAQALVAASILILSFSVMVICLVLQARLKNLPAISGAYSLPPSTSDNFRPFICNAVRSKSVSSIYSVYHHPLTRSSSMVLEAYSCDGDNESFMSSESLFSPSDDMPNFSVVVHNSNPKMNATRKISRQLTEPEECAIVRDRDDEFQILRHVVLMLALGCSMFVGIALCIWTLVMEKETGIYVMLLFLDETLNFGQGVFGLVLFALEPRRLLNPVWSGLRKQIKPPSVSTNSVQEKTHTCEQFLTFYMDKCKRDLVRDRKWHLKQYSNVFCGNELVDWLLIMGLSRDRYQAVEYGQNLLSDNIICHVESRKDFQDQPYFYAFKV